MNAKMFKKVNADEPNINNCSEASVYDQNDENYFSIRDLIDKPEHLI